LAEFDVLGARGVRLNTDNKGGMPIGLDQIGELCARIRPFGWHIEWLFPGKDIVELMPVFARINVPMSIGHFAYQPAAAGVRAPGFQALLELMRRGNTWMKISGANRVSATDLPPYDDVKPLAQAPTASCGAPTGRIPTNTWSIPMTAIWSTPSATG
jgi:2-pyrone-4,6-dicarboxylate lactonase